MSPIALAVFVLVAHILVMAVAVASVRAGFRRLSDMLVVIAQAQTAGHERSQRDAPIHVADTEKQVGRHHSILDEFPSEQH